MSKKPIKQQRHRQSQNPIQVRAVRRPDLDIEKLGLALSKLAATSQPDSSVAPKVQALPIAELRAAIERRSRENVRLVEELKQRHKRELKELLKELTTKR